MVPVCSSHLWTCWLLFPCPFTVHDDFFSQITFLPYFLVIGCTGATGGKVWNTSDASTVFRTWSGKKHSNWNLQHLGTIQSCTCCISCLYFRLNSTALRYCQGRDQKGEGSERQNKGTFRKLCTNGLNQRVIQFRGMEGHEVSCFLGKGSVELSKKKKKEIQGWAHFLTQCHWGTRRWLQKAAHAKRHCFLFQRKQYASSSMPDCNITGHAHSRVCKQWHIFLRFRNVSWYI